MPVILPEKLWETWLKILDLGPDLTRELLIPCPASKKVYYPVSRKVNKPEFNKVECIKPLEED